MIEKFSIELSTKARRELVNITSFLERKVEEIKGKGIICIYVPHTTAGLMINEDEQGLKKDVLNILEKLVPESGNYFHNEIDDNADAHLLSILLKNNACIPFENGRLLLGTWQSVFFVELDGPRSRRVEALIIYEA
mgnify:CR=1 FL=1